MRGPAVAIREGSGRSTVATTDSQTTGSGRDPSFEEFYSRHSRSLVLQLNAYLGNLADAQDIAQEAMCRALARWDKVSTYDEPVAWVRRVAWNLAVSKWRRQRTATSFLMRQRPEYMAGPDPDRVALVRVLASLPERQRKVFVLFYIGELTVADIARQEGIAEGTVKTWLHRGRAAIADQLSALRRENCNG